MRISGKRTPYRECPLCGSHLDAGEVCDCGKPQPVPIKRDTKEIIVNGAGPDEKTA